MKAGFFLLAAIIVLSGTGVFSYKNKWEFRLAIVYVMLFIGAAIYWWPESASVPLPSKPTELVL